MHLHSVFRSRHESFHDQEKLSTWSRIYVFNAADLPTQRLDVGHLQCAFGGNHSLQQTAVAAVTMQVQQTPQTGHFTAERFHLSRQLALLLRVFLQFLASRNKTKTTKSNGCSSKLR